jgi:hypothetical protein
MTKRENDEDQEEPNKKQIMITADELELYDRQIRLWGMEAQTRYYLLIKECAIQEY